MTVQQWLDSERDYEAGRQLYEQLGDNARLKQILGHGPSTYNCEALAWELSKLARAAVVTVDVTTAVTTPPKGDESQEPNKADSSPNATDSLQTVTKGDESTAAVLLASLAQARRPLYDERTVLHQSLEHQPTEADTLAAARRILQLSREVDANWKTTAHVREHGELPPGPPPAPGLETLTPAELVRKRNNLRSQVSKLKKRPDRAEDLAAAEATLSQVETLLNPEK